MVPNAMRGHSLVLLASPVATTAPDPVMAKAAPVAGAAPVPVAGAAPVAGTAPVPVAGAVLVAGSVSPSTPPGPVGRVPVA